jgi:hypothetical protein
MPKRHPSSAPVSQAAAISKPTTELPPPAIAESHRPPVLSGAAAEKRCNALDAEYNAQMQASLKEKYNTLSPCDKTEHADCGCSGASAADKKVDLIILLDSSGSMSSAGNAVAAAAEATVAAAHEACPSDLRVAWFTVDGRKPGANPPGDLGDITALLASTPFTQTHQQYLEGIGATGPFKQDEPQPPCDPTYPGEEGADAIADLAHFYDWRPGACRSIFYISDTKLDGYSSFDAAAAANAATAATSSGVVVFAHHIGAPPPPMTSEMQAYLDMCTPTGGTAYFGAIAPGVYEALIRDAICGACNVPCKVMNLEGVKPCVSMAWGDSACDCLETSDFEVAIVTLCNCFSNVGFSNVHIGAIEVTYADGSPVETLPDGRPAVQIVPSGGVCFGDIGPCIDGKPSCVSREIVIRTQGARPGSYRVHLKGVCFQVRSSVTVDECLALTLCKD